MVLRNMFLENQVPSNHLAMHRLITHLEHTPLRLRMLHIHPTIPLRSPPTRHQCLTHLHQNIILLLLTGLILKLLLLFILSPVHHPPPRSLDQN